MSLADIAQNERIRGLAEKNAQANYRALIASAGKDRAKVRMAASEQAGFSSRRAERCDSRHCERFKTWPRNRSEREESRVRSS